MKVYKGISISVTYRGCFVFYLNTKRKIAVSLGGSTIEHPLKRFIEAENRELQFIPDSVTLLLSGVYL